MQRRDAPAAMRRGRWSRRQVVGAVAIVVALGPAIAAAAVVGSGPRAAVHGSGNPAPPSPALPAASNLPVGTPLQSQPASGPACPAAAVHPASTMDANGPAGMDTEGACATFHQGFRPGDPETVVAYVEGGVNWHLPGLNQAFADHIYVNWRELPVPCVGDTTFGVSTSACVTAWSADLHAYDVDGDGLVNVEEWAHDPRLLALGHQGDVNGNGFLDPEDLVAAFSCFDRFTMTVGTPGWTGGVLHCTNGDAATVSNDGSGFPHDISGWDVYDDSNDSATVDAAYDHSDGEMQNVMAYCPKCMVMPVKAGAEALDRTDDLAQAWLYAGHAGAEVITSVTADLGYSSFMSQAVHWLTAHGVAMVEASNDFDSTDHQGGMFWPGVMPGNGVLVDQSGTKWIRSDITSWGTHSLFDVAGQDTTSSSTAVMGGLAGLLMAEGQDAYTAHELATPFTGAEALQVLRQASRPVTDTTLAWPGAPGDWSEQYGYGIPDMNTALGDVAHGRVAPVAEITSPAWYSLSDPTRTQDVVVDGTIGAPRDGAGYTWSLQYGLGPQPTSWTTVASHAGSGAYSGQLGVLDLSAIPRSFFERPFAMSQDRELSTADQYDVTLRLVVTPHDGTPAATDRRTIDVVHDPSWLGNFPLPISSSGESQPALADLAADDPLAAGTPAAGAGRLDIVFGTADGLVHAVDPATGQDIPGWPVATDAVTPRWLPAGIDPGHDAVVADVAVGDLTHDGHLSVVVATEGGKVFVYDAAGHVEAGWPKTLDDGVVAPAVPRPALAYTRLPTTGSVAAPVLVDLTGTGQLDVVQAGWDGELHAWNAAGDDVAGWPVRVPRPTAGPPGSGYVLVDDHKLDAGPAVAYLDGPGKPPTLVERSQYTYTKGAGLQFGATGFVYAYGTNGKPRAGWPAEVPAVAEYYSSAQEFITEGTSSVVAADVTGTGLGPDEVAVSTPLSPPLLLDGAGQIVGAYGGPAPGAGMLTYPGAPTSLVEESHLPDVPISFATTGGAFGKLGGTLHFGAAQSGGASLAAAELESNGGLAINEYESVFPATGGVQSPGFPGLRMGIDFLGSPMFTSVDGTGLGDVVDGGDSDALTAYTPLGTEAPGFPKWTTGWTIFSPASGDLFGDGANELVTVSREGQLFVWTTQGRATGNDQWWRLQHDEYNSGNYEMHTRPPGAVRGLDWSPGHGTASFMAPGATWYDGTVDHYLVTFVTRLGTVHQTLRPAGPAGTRQQLLVPPGTTRVTVQAVGPSGLVDVPASAS